jgi:hypothetical protein
MVIDSRRCDQCGEMFTPQREHARFCTASCRVTWNRQHVDDLPLLADTLDWSIAAMWQATERLARVPGCDPADGFAIVAEAVWWVTMVDATVVRYHADAYTALLDGLSQPEREVTEDTFGGLRFVRNRMAYDGLSSFIQPTPVRLARTHGAGDAAGTVGDWTWTPVPEPTVPALSGRGRKWEMTRYRSYQAQLAGRPVGQTFDRATAFLRRACRLAELR